MQSFVKDVYWRPDNVLGNGENHTPVPVPATKTYLAYSKCQMNLFSNLLTPHFPPTFTDSLPHLFKFILLEPMAYFLCVNATYAKYR